MSDREGAASLLRQLVQIPSVNPRAGAGPAELALARFIAGWMAERGMPASLAEVLPGRPNVLATLPGQDVGRILLLESHMDTVEVEGMTIPPFGGEVADGRVYGRGACDAKGQLAAMMLAMADLAVRGVKPPLTVQLVAAVDEEYLFRGVHHLMAGRRDFAAAVVGEPTELDLIVAHKGSVRFQVTARGRAAHSSTPWDGDNAIERMAAVVRFIRESLVPELAERRHPRVGPPTLCVSLIQGGSAINTVPERCTIDIDRRTVPGEDPRAVWADYQRRLEALMPGHVQVAEPYLVDVAMDTAADSPIVAALREQVRRSGKEPAVTGVNYGTDASKIAAQGVPTVVFGPGSIQQAHKAEEYLELDQLVAAARILAGLLESFRG